MTKIRIPASRAVIVSSAFGRIIDTPIFQRLRGVKQLGPTELVFPGATHTRFEHSLGVFTLAARYMERLATLEAFRADFDTEEKVKRATDIALLCALLHDVGHYPFSHWIEEIGSFHPQITIETHENRLSAILRTSGIAEIIRNDFGFSAEAITNVISKRPRSADERLAHSIVDSVLDVDKLDYLRRDSIHCGVDYGHGLDADRLLDGLWYRRRANTICLTEKARTYVMSLLACRNLMYQEVYWHKTVRTCTAMIKRAFYEVCFARPFEEAALRDLLLATDNAFISRLLQTANEYAPGVSHLIQPFAYEGRQLYKVLLQFNEQQRIPFPVVRNYFRSIANVREYPTLVSRSEALARAIGEYLGIDVSPIDVLIENTPVKENGGGERYDIANLEIWNTKTEEFERPPEKVNDLNEFLSSNRQVFVLCLHSIRDKLQSKVRESRAANAGFTVWDQWNEILGHV